MDSLESRLEEFSKENGYRISLKLYVKILRFFEDWKSQTTPDVWAEFRKADPGDCHFGLGMWIRNTYLWHDEKIQSEFFDDGHWHVDDMSAVILEIWHKECEIIGDE